MSTVDNINDGSHCLVCGAEINGMRLGVNACRACALFFKRTTMSKRKYMCRRSDFKCVIVKDDQFMCRRCRFEKCKDLGMELPTNRKKSTPKKRDDFVMEPRASSFILSLPITGGESLLKRIAKEYRVFRERRISNENFLRGTTVYNMKQIQTDSGDTLHFCVNDFRIDAVPATLAEGIAVYEAVFPEISLTANEKYSMIKFFAGAYHIMEMNYYTEKYFPGNDRFQMVTHTTCIDMKRIEEYFSGNDRMLTNDWLKGVEFYFKKFINMTRPPTREANFTETEFHAAMCIVIWDIGYTSWMPPNVVNIGERVKQQVLSELSRYYKETMKCYDYASRLGRLLSLIQTMQEAGSFLQEQLQLYRLLGIFKNDDLAIKVLI